VVEGRVETAYGAAEVVEGEANYRPRREMAASSGDASSN
jgi:hypothetical protein